MNRSSGKVMTLGKIFLSLLFIVLIIGGCGKDFDGEKVSNISYENIQFPERDSECPYYYNDSDVTGDDETAIKDLILAKEFTKLDIAVAIVKSIPDELNIGEYSAGLFDHWKMGHKNGGKGLLIVFGEDYKEIKIEVGYALEHIFTDAKCGRYENEVRYHYSPKLFGDVICGVIWKMIKQYRSESVDNKKLKPLATKFLSGGAGLMENDLFDSKDKRLDAALKNGDKESAVKFQPLDSPEETALRYIDLLESGNTYPYIPLLTEGSQLYRVEWPFWPGRYKAIAERYRNAEKYKVYEQGKYAVVRFTKAPVSDIFMIKNKDGKWLVDKTWSKTCSIADFYHGTNRLIFKDHKWMFAYPEHERDESRMCVPEPLADSINVKQRIIELRKAISDAPDEASNYFKLADVLYWECGWCNEAIEVCEKGLELEPGKIEYYWLANEVRTMLPARAGIPRLMEKLLELTPYDRCVYSQLGWFYKKVRVNPQKYEEVRQLFDRASAKFDGYADCVIKTGDSRKIRAEIRKIWDWEFMNQFAQKLIQTGNYSDAEYCHQIQNDYFGCVNTLIEFYLNNIPFEPQLKERYDILVKKIFPDGYTNVSLDDFSGPPAGGTIINGESPLAQKYGISDGDIIVALDGIKVESLYQYLVVRGLTSSTKLDFVLWNGKSYYNSIAYAPNRLLGVRICNYQNNERLCQSLH